MSSRTPPGAVRRAAVCVALVAVLAGCTGRGASPDDASAGGGLTEPPSLGPVLAPPSATNPLRAPDIGALYDTSSASSVTVVVTKRRPLDPADYVPGDLVNLTGIPGGGGQRMRSVAAQALTRMWQDASEAGAPFRVSTAYRPYGFQQSLYQGYVASYGRASADARSARPGFSEHQTGLALDVYETQEDHLKESFAATAAGRWLADHAYAYGFILSYPEGKADVTGYTYEPWHLRYVGEDVAGAMRAEGVVTLQEFMSIEASPDYG